MAGTVEIARSRRSHEPGTALERRTVAPSPQFAGFA